MLQSTTHNILCSWYSEEINNLSELKVLRLEYNYLNGFVPNTICDLAINNNDYLESDITGNKLCPPYPECIGMGDFWYQDTSSCSELGDINYDGIINISDVIIIIFFRKSDKKLSLYLLQLTKQSETRGNTEIKIYPPYGHVMVMFRRVEKWVFKPFS